jgi:hypothetical protein
VSWHARARKWRVKLKFGGRDYNLGYYDDEVVAARVYDAAALMVRGRRVRFNFDGEPPATVTRAAIRKRLIELGAIA